MVKEKRIDSFFKRKRTDFEARDHEPEPQTEAARVTPTVSQPEPERAT